MSREPGPSWARRLWERLRIKYRSSESIIEEYGHWKPPNEDEARENFWKQHAHHHTYDVGTPVSSLKEFGEGVLLYFYLLKFCAIVFSVLALFPGLLLVVFNGLGGWYDKADLERTMLGNYGLLTYNGRSTSLNMTSSAFASRSASVEGAVTALFAATVSGTPARMHGMDKRALLVAMSALDLVGVLIFFGFSVFMIWFVRSRSRAAAAATSAVMLPDYALQVGRLPPDTSAAALKDYILQAAGEGTEIVRVELCRKVDHLLELVVERGQVLPQLDLALAVLQRKAEVFPRVSEFFVVDLLYARYLLAAVTDAIRHEQAAATSNEVVTAFVTFATPESRRRAQAALPASMVHRLRTPPEARFNNGGIGTAGKKPVALELVPAPQPSDVQYENLEYSLGERVARKTMSDLAKYLVLLAGFLVVSLAPAMRMGVAASGNGPSRAQCDASCTIKDATGNYALTAANRSLYKGCDPVAGTGALPSKLDCEAQTACYECFCRAALSAGSYGEMLYCSRFGSVVAVATLAQMCAVLGIVAANFMIQIAISWLVRQEKHHTRSREVVGIVRGLFITQFVNTAFSNLVANMYLPGPANVISHSFLNGYIFSGSYADTTPNWYHDVCRPIMISVFLTTVLVHVKVFVRWWWRRRCLAQRYVCLTQRQLEDAYTGHEFELAVKYGQHLYIIFVVMTYSAGMPLLYTLAAIHFITCYWSEKFELLKICKRPLAYSRDVALYVSSSLPFAALWHLALGLWLFSLFGVPMSPLFSNAFRRSLQSSVNAFRGLIPVASSLTPYLVARRFTQNSAGHLFIAFIAFGGFVFIFFTLSTWLEAMRSLLRLLGVGLGKGGREDAAEAARTATMPEFWVAARSQLLVGPASYAVEQNPAYAHAFVRMEELEWEKREEMFAKAAADAAAAFAAAQAAAAAANEQGAPQMGGPRESRRKRTAASRLRAKQHAAKAAAAGWTYDPSANWGLPYGFGAGGAKGGNKVAPEPIPGSIPDGFKGKGVASDPDDPGQPLADLQTQGSDWDPQEMLLQPRDSDKQQPQDSPSTPSQPGTGPRKSSWTQLTPAGSAVPVYAAAGAPAAPTAPTTDTRRSFTAFGAAGVPRQSAATVPTAMAVVTPLPPQGQASRGPEAGLAGGAAADPRSAASRTSASGLTAAQAASGPPEYQTPLPSAPSVPGAAGREGPAPETSAKSYGGWERQRPPRAPASPPSSSATAALAAAAAPAAAPTAAAGGRDGRSSVRAASAMAPPPQQQQQAPPEASQRQWQGLGAGMGTAGRAAPPAQAAPAAPGQPRKWADLSLS